MISSLVIIIAAVMMEVAGLQIAWYLIGCWLIMVRRGLAVAVVAASIGGILIDSLFPRHLGVTPITILVILIVTELTLGRARGKEMELLIVGVGLVILEGIIVGRNPGMIVVGILVLVTIQLGSRLFGRSSGGIVVRREI